MVQTKGAVDEGNALAMAADTGLWLRPAQYERTARAAGNARIELKAESLKRKAGMPRE